MTEQEHSGIPTRAIHESYLDMQRSLTAYRRATDSGTNKQIEQAHGSVQDSVLAFYELLRPHIKSVNAVDDYWDGKAPPYKTDQVPDPEEGKAILQVQKSHDTYSIQQFTSDVSEFQGLRDWHDALGLNGNTRLLGVKGMGQNVFITYHTYQKGLRHLDNWQTEYVERESTMGGFYSHKKETTVERKRVDMDRLKRAARELSDVAEQLGALSHFDATTPRTEITEEEISRLEAWQQENL